MKYMLRGLLRSLQPVSEQKRHALSQRLQRIFFMDGLEGQLDCLVRSMSRCRATQSSI